MNAIDYLYSFAILSDYDSDYDSFDSLYDFFSYYDCDFLKRVNKLIHIRSLFFWALTTAHSAHPPVLSISLSPFQGTVRTWAKQYEKKENGKNEARKLKSGLSSRFWLLSGGLSVIYF